MKQRRLKQKKIRRRKSQNRKRRKSPRDKDRSRIGKGQSVGRENQDGSDECLEGREEHAKQCKRIKLSKRLKLVKKMKTRWPTHQLLSLPYNRKWLKSVIKPSLFPHHLSLSLLRHPSLRLQSSPALLVRSKLMWQRAQPHLGRLSRTLSTWRQVSKLRE